MPARCDSRRLRPAVLTVTLLVTTGTAAAGPRPTARPRSAMDALQVACVQLDNHPDIDENARRIVAALEREAMLGTRLVVFPECALTTYDSRIIATLTQPQIDRALNTICAACRASDIYAVVGSACTEGGKWHNAAYVIDTAGRIIKRYIKLHVVKPRFFTDGRELAIFRIDGVPTTIMICHDERYPEIFRIPVLAGARVGIYISSESKRPGKWDNYRCQIIGRAVENQISVIHCNAGDGGADGGSHGHSRIIDPAGNVLAEAGTGVRETIRAVIRPKDSSKGHATRGADSPDLRAFWAEGLRVLRLHNPDYFRQAAPKADRPRD